jgi:hypothetical protein
MAKRTTNTVAVNIRIPVALAEKADRLLPWAATQPDVSPTGHATRTELLRVAMVLGMDALVRRERRSRGEGDDE